MSDALTIDPRKLTLTVSPPNAWWQNVDLDRKYQAPEEMMTVALIAAENNLCTKEHSENLGGPFGAATFLPIGGGKFKLFSLAGNLVLATGQADSHAEVLAGRFASARLKEAGDPEPYNLWHKDLTMVTTSAPCAMCENYLIWARPTHVIAGTTITDTQQELGFHEGCLPTKKTGEESWTGNLKRFGINVTTGVMRDAVIERLFRRYQGPIYNGGE